MLYHSSILAVLTVLAATSAAPLTIPLGTNGELLTISNDGQSISIGRQTINLGQAGEGKRKGGKGGGAAAAGSNAKAIYFMTNTANNSIVALKVAADGTVSDGSVTATGGAGMSGVDSTGAPAAPDALFSQGSVKVAGNVSAIHLDSSQCSMFNLSSIFNPSGTQTV
jgi:hypothetical protein